MWVGGAWPTPLDSVTRVLPACWRLHAAAKWKPSFHRQVTVPSRGYAPQIRELSSSRTEALRRSIPLRAQLEPESNERGSKPTAAKRAPRTSRRKVTGLKAARSSKTAVAKATAQSDGVQHSTEAAERSPLDNEAAVGNRKALVIVESPAKARTIQKFLPPNYIVESCMGHVRDLPQTARQVPAELKEHAWARLGVDVEDSFRPLYVVPENRRETVERLREQLTQANELVLATDEDREGEAISWHLVELLQPQVPVRRAVFHEITEDAIQEAFQSFRDIDMNLVHAQETRRILDRLAGYTLSPLLWKKIAPGLSAGRVQSVALAMIVERELERLRFRSAQYWSILAQLRIEHVQGTESPILEAELVRIGEARLAIGKDFDGRTGKLREDVQSENTNGRVKVIWLDEPTANRLAAEAQSAPPGSFRIVSIERRQVTRTPPLAFTTSTLQQEASRRLRVTTLQVMRAAQSLYEGGYITYMRTDSPQLSMQATEAARRAAAERFGAEQAVPAQAAPRKTSKKPKGAQEAHEAIRPAGRAFTPPEALSLEPLEKRLYELIYYRTLASEMQPAKLRQTTLTIEGPKEMLFRASGTEVEFPGWLLAYEALRRVHEHVSESGSAASVNEDSALDEQGLLPRDVHLSEGDSLTAVAVDPVLHETKAPARYTEASLVKELETNGVGRPSTYVSIIETLLERSYVIRKGSSGSASSLVPTLTAFVVVRFLQHHFPNFVDVRFTSEMEAALDLIARGEADRIAYLQQYYCGESGLAAAVRAKSDTIDVNEARRVYLPALEGDAAAPEVTGEAKTTAADGERKEWPKPLVYVGPYGPYVVYGEKVSLPREISAEQVTLDTLRRLAEQRKCAAELGVDPQTGMHVYLRTGPYGPYVQLGEDPGSMASHTSTEKSAAPSTDDAAPTDKQLDSAREASPGTSARSTRRARGTGTSARAPHEKPKRVSLPSWLDPARVDLEVALRLLSLPRIVGEHPATGEIIRAGYGRLGPYLLYQDKFTSLSKYEPGGASDPLFIDLETAVHILDTAKTSKSRSRSTKSKTSDTAEEANGASSESADAAPTENDQLKAPPRRGTAPRTRSRKTSG
jgi:DNA topoisomerase-1